MLNDIKGIIKQKADFLEAAALIFEDGSGQNLDDVIILGEEADVPPSPQEESSEDDNLPKEDSTEGEDAESGESSEEPKEGEEGDGEDHPATDADGEIEDIGDLPIGDPTSTPAEPQGDEDDLLNADIDEPPMPLPGSDLPTPIGAQTGEPINPEDDLLNVEIDLGSNTVKDVLPIPPANANEALADGSDTQHVDSGFGESKEEPKEDPKDDSKTKKDASAKPDEKDIPVKESAKPFWESFFSKPGGNFSEAITLGDEPAAEPAPAEDPGSAPATEEPAAEAPASGEEESEVTSAVRDKVAEVDSPAPAESGDGAKEDLLKKLGNITKNLEDAKKAVMSAI